MKLNKMFIFLLFSTLLISCSHKSTKTQLDSSKIEIYRLKTDVLVGTSKAGQSISIGGFSALQLKAVEGSKLTFYTITDRGPNPLSIDYLEGVGKNARPFLLPDYSPLLIEISTSHENKTFGVNNLFKFKTSKTKYLTGLPPNNNKAKEFEIPIDLYGNKLNFDSNGSDSEGFCKFHNNYLISEEYGPSLYMFDSEMLLLKKWSPGSGLPADYLKRKMNRGLESLACSKKYAYMMLQSPLITEDKKDKNHIRLAKFDPVRGKIVAEYFYPVKSKEADKIGDISLISEDKLIVIEQNGKLGSENGVRKIYKIDLTSATADGKLQKELIVDLNKLGFDFVEKIEGIAYINSKQIAIITDNDFGLHGALDLKTGVIPIVPKESYLAIIHLEKDIN